MGCGQLLRNDPATPYVVTNGLTGFWKAFKTLLHIRFACVAKTIASYLQGCSSEGVIHLDKQEQTQSSILQPLHIFRIH